jgi:putative transposase
MKPGTFTQMYVHLLYGMNPVISVSDTVHDIKRSTSIFINENRLVPGRLLWQEGYGGFTYNRSQIEGVFRYIKNQEEHHARKTFREEYLSYLEKYEIEYDPRFLFEFYDQIP